MSEDGSVATGAVYETADDAGKGDAGLVKFWLENLSLADTEEKDWRKDGERIIEIYRGSRSALGSRNGVSTARNSSSFNILRANVRTLRPNLYNSTPKPDIRRRYGDKDELSKFAGDLLERCAGVDLDLGQFDDVMLGCIQDMLLVGRGVPWVRLDGVVIDDQQVKSLAVRFELVPWDEFRRSSGKRWDDVYWVARRHLMRKEEIAKMNPRIGERITLDCSIGGKSRNDQDKDIDVYKRAEVWEIWDKDTKQVVWIAKAWKDEPLKVAPDPLQLRDFFPCPFPMYDDCDTSSLVPVPDYLSYEAQAKELEALTLRIQAMIKVIKWRGAYDAVLSEFGKIDAAEDGVLVPIDNAAAVRGAGGLAGSVWLMPIDMAINVLRELYAARAEVKQAIFEITGIADIQRGASNPNETLGAQQLKAQWGSGRMQERQRVVQRCARDLLRMKVELLAEHAPQDLLLEMAGMEFPQPEMPPAPPQQMPPSPRPMMPPAPMPQMPPPVQSPALPMNGSQPPMVPNGTM